MELWVGGDGIGDGILMAPFGDGYVVEDVGEYMVTEREGEGFGEVDKVGEEARSVVGWGEGLGVGGRVDEFGDRVGWGRLVEGGSKGAPLESAEAALEWVEGCGHELDRVIVPLNGIQSV